MDARPDRLVARARDRLDAGDPYGAIHLLREVIASGRAFADAHHLLGLAYSLVGQLEPALEEFDRALVLNPRYVDAHLNRAVTLNDLGRYDDASGAIVAAQALGAVDHTGVSAPAASRLANMHAELGEAYVEAGGIAQAIRQFEAAVELRPEFLDLRYRLARLRLAEGDAAGARKDLETIVAARPGYQAALSSLGMAAYLCGDREAARTAWEACRAKAPDDPRVKAYLSLLERAGSCAARRRAAGRAAAAGGGRWCCSRRRGARRARTTSASGTGATPTGRSRTRSRSTASRCSSGRPRRSSGPSSPRRRSTWGR